jgi:hypothetical protein
VSPMRYKHVHIKSNAIPGTGREDVFPLRYGHHLHIKSKAIAVTGRKDVFLVKYEHYLHIEM